jgi:flagellar hook-basal body complex protein FliE
MNLGEILSVSGAIGSKQPVQNLLPQDIKGGSFSQILKDAVVDLNTEQVTAYDAMKSIATGKVENLQEAVKQLEEAELSLKLGLEIKSKALGAYKQIMALQV